MTNLFALNPDRPAPQVLHVGAGAVPVAVFDAVFADPEALVDAVARQGRFAAPERNAGGYPGLSCPAPPAYTAALVAAIDPALAVLFGSDDGTLGEMQCRFSLVTLRPDELHPLQSVPHIDFARASRFAALHYLCGESYGGTAFYRHRESGLERVSQADWPRLEAARDRLLSADWTPAYPSEQTPGYEQIGMVPARFNRVIVYPSDLLHSGVIPPGLAHPADPRTGRLTGNLFARYRPRQGAAETPAAAM